MYPDFLCIGALKSGTTWLYHNLRSHPEIRLTPVKELHYFNNPTQVPNIIRMFKKNWMLRQLKTSTNCCLQEKRYSQLAWFLRFYFFRRNDRWYSSLFSRDFGQKVGEVTPTYSVLQEKAVARIYGLMPNVRIIYILRNPIIRTWSEIAMYYQNRGRLLKNIRDDELFKFLQTGWGSRNSNYIGNLQTWEKFYPKTNFFIGFYDQLAENPRDFIRSIYNFLEVDSSKNLIPDTVHIMRNTHKYPEIPIRFSSYLAHKYYDQIERLHRRFENRYTADWLKFAERVLS